MWLDWTFANQINVLLTPPHTRTCTHCCCLLSFLSCKPDVWLLLRGLPWLWPLQMFTTTSAGDGVTKEKRDRTEEGWGRCLYLWKTHIRGVLWGHCRLWQREGSGALSPLLSLSLCNWIQLRWKCSEGALQFALLNNNVCSGVAWAAVHFERSRSSVQTHRGQCTGRLQPDHTGLWWKPVLLRTVKSPAGVFIYGFKQKKTTTKTLWAHEPWHDDSGHTQPQGLLLVKVSNVDCCSSSLSVWMIVI